MSSVPEFRIGLHPLRERIDNLPPGSQPVLRTFEDEHMTLMRSTAGLSAIAMLATSCSQAASEDRDAGQYLAPAVAETTTVVEEDVPLAHPNPGLHAELTRALGKLPEHGGSGAKVGRGARCYYNCPPPVGSVTASPQVINVPAGGIASVTLHWRLDQSYSRQVTRHGCLWMSGDVETEAHMVQCERPGHTYATTVTWIGAGTYTFRVAPGNPKGPFTRPIAGIYQLAQATVVGASP